MNQQKPSMVVPALIGAVFLGITSALPLVNFINCACCALVIGGGIIASFLYLRDYPPHLPPMTYGDGAVLGVLTGVLGSLIWTAVNVPLTFFKFQLGAGMTDLSELREALNEANIPPEVSEMILNLFSGSALSIGMIIFEFLINIVISLIFATLGAIIGVALFQKKPPMNYPSTGTPQPGPPPSGPAPPPPGESS